MNLISRKHAGCFGAPLKDSNFSERMKPSIGDDRCVDAAWRKGLLNVWLRLLPGNYTDVRNFYLLWSKIRSYVISQHQLCTYAAGHVLLAGWRWWAHTFPVSSLQADTFFFSDVFSGWCGTSICGAARVASSTISLTELHWFICSDSQRNWPRLLLWLRWTWWKPD